MQQFKSREASLAEAEQAAASYSARESALTAQRQSVSDLEDNAQRAHAAAEYARKEADAVWQKQKVTQQHGVVIAAVCWLEQRCLLCDLGCSSSTDSNSPLLHVCLCRYNFVHGKLLLQSHLRLPVLLLPLSVHAPKKLSQI